METFQDMLRGMRLTGGVFLEAECTAPWCVTSQVTPEDCAPFARVPRQIISYHYVTAGQMLLKVSGAAPVTVTQGEIVVLPRNDPHVIGSTLSIPPADAGHPVTPIRKPGWFALSSAAAGPAPTSCAAIWATTCPTIP